MSVTLFPFPKRHGKQQSLKAAVYSEQDGGELTWYLLRNRLNQPVSFQFGEVRTCAGPWDIWYTNKLDVANHLAENLGLTVHKLIMINSELVGQDRTRPRRRWWQKR